ncbi:uncharacterized protein NEMAJ01_1237 [Nematocida major]|uniref:uncharacterized protein n=1 Tax=Nematocida major TaxID=1912982 RepID=UPI00200797CB|nr:uncharacterized protein NEMAJ01_1237 [Nematocida major]KAH9386341.1 hypothetical protein NEMAJ01_1237 [Nematocida major]
MAKKYMGMVFSKDRAFTAKTKEEEEVFSLFNRKIHSNDLEDDFFDLGDGAREAFADEHAFSSDSSTLDMSNEEDSWAESAPPAEKESKPAALPAKEPEMLKKDCFASLVDQINAKNGGAFNALSKILHKPRKPVKREKKASASIDECNEILSRMGGYIPQTPEEAPAPKKQKKTEDKQDRCENWEDQPAAAKKNQPNII